MIDTETVTAHLDEAIERMVKMLDRNPDYRVLRRIPEPFSRPFDTIATGSRVIAIVDVETTGLDTATDRIIELAIMMVIVNRHGDILNWMRPHAWLEDPGMPLSKEVQRLTGLTDAMLAGQVINEEFAEGLLERADLVLAHNALFDLAFVERRFPDLVGKAWACTASEIDWRGLGFEGRGLQNLLMQSGWFTTGHRAAADVWATWWLLRQRAGGHGPTNLRRVLDASSQATTRIDACHAPFAAKNAMKSRGYRWDADRRNWWIELAEPGVAAERAWLRGIGVHAPRMTPITAKQRHRPIKVVPIDFGVVDEGDPF